MITTIKNLLAKWLLADKLRELDDAGKRIGNQLFEFKKSEAQAKENFLASFDPADFVIAKLKGFDPELVLGRRVGITEKGVSVVDGDVLLAATKKGIGEDEFLAEMAKIHKSRSFQFLIDFLNGGQIALSFFMAKNDAAMNFGRAHVGGHEQVRGEVERLHSVFEDRQKKPEEFDAHEVV